MTELRDLTPHTSISHEQASRDGRQRRLLRTFLPELVGLERILAEAPDFITTEVVERVALKDLSLPIYRVDIGSSPARRPGRVHHDRGAAQQLPHECRREFLD